MDIATDLAAYRQRLGYVPEEPALYGFLSGREYLELVAQLRALPSPVIRETIAALLRLLNLDEAAEQDISAYSKGMRQKVALVAAVMHDPDVLILDEPETGLDVPRPSSYASWSRRGRAGKGGALKSTDDLYLLGLDRYPRTPGKWDHGVSGGDHMKAARWATTHA